MYGYLVTNIVTNEQYVGITSQTPPTKRWVRHISEAKYHKGPPLLHEAMRKYGVGAFIFEPKAVYDTQEAMLQGERDMIIQYGTLAPKGYNKTVGGQGTSGYKWSDEARANLSAKTKGRSMAHTRAAASAATKGKPLSLGHRTKIGNAHKGKKQGPMSEEQKIKLSIAHTGLKRGAETCARISAYHKLRWSRLPRSCRLYDPNGTLVEISDLRQFCKDHGLVYWKMKYVAFRDRIQCEGWKRSLDRVDKVKKPFAVISPVGERFEGVGLRGFCVERGLDPSGMKQLVAGKRQTYLGWRKV